MIEVAVYDTKPYDKTYLERAGENAAIRWRFHEFRLNADSAATVAGAAACSVFVNDRVDRICLEALAAAGVGLVALRCAGYNNVDVGAARDLGVRLVRVPAYSPHAVAEHAVGLLLTLNRKIHRAYNRVREHNFSLHGLIGFDLSGKSVGIIGTGRIGRIAAQIFRGFDMRVLAYDVLPDIDWAARHGITYDGLDALLTESDVISLHLPLTPDTHHLLDARTLSALRPGVFIVNTSRGKLIDTAALIHGLKSRHIGGVALDVYEEEEGVFFEDLSGDVLQDDELTRLLTFPNVLVTSHQAFLTDEALTEIARTTVENLLRYSARREPLDGTDL